MFPFLNSRPSIFLGEDFDKLKEIGTCLGITGYLTMNQLILTSVLGHTISTNTITLDQQLPQKLESYLITSQEVEDAWQNYISNLSLKQFDIDTSQLEHFAQPLVIQSKGEKQFQIIKNQSNRQVGYQQKKEDGLISNQIVNTNSRSISPQPMSTIFTQSHAPDSQYTQYNPNSSFQSSGKHLEDKSKEKILFQDRYVVEESRQSNRIVVKRSEDPQFFQQLKNARIASPLLRQVKGPGLSPEPQISQSKSKSPDIMQVNLPKNCKKWESNNQQKQVQQIKQSSKLPDHFKKLLNDSSRRVPKPFDSNNTKYSQKQQEITSQLNQAKSSSFLSKQQQDFLPIKTEERQQQEDSYDQQRSKSSNKKYDSEKLLEQFKNQNQSIRDQFSFKPQVQMIEQPKIQLVESKSLRSVSPQNRSVKQDIKQENKKEPIQIKLDIKQFMNSNKPHSPIQMARENGRNLYVNVNFHK